MIPFCNPQDKGNVLGAYLVEFPMAGLFSPQPNCSMKQSIYKEIQIIYVSNIYKDERIWNKLENHYCSS